MGILKKLSAFFGSGGGADPNVHWEYVRCSRCGEKIPVRIHLLNELTEQDDEAEGEGAYYVRKGGIIGNRKPRCFQQIELELRFDAERRVISRQITGGEFINAEEFHSDREGA